jgi:hypothetical protein
MVKPISLRLRNAEILAKARATLIREGRGDELKRAHTAAVMKEARANVARAREQARLKRCAVLAAQKAIAVARQAFRFLDGLSETDYEREHWRALKTLVINELTRITEGRRP